MIAKNKTQQTFSPAELSRIIEMAWEDRTPFEAIEAQFNLSETDVIQLMRKSLRGGAFRLWRRRASGRVTKHQNLRPKGVLRAYCPSQYKNKSK